MSSWLKSSLLALVAAAFALSAVRSRADEGMWLFNNPPKKILQEKYGFDATPEWLLHLQRPASASTAAARARSSRPTAW